MKKIIFLCLLSVFSFCVFAQKYESESGVVKAGRVESEAAGFSGKAYVRFASVARGSSEITVKIKKDGLYGFNLGYSSTVSEKICSVQAEVDGKYLVSQQLKKTEGFEKVPLNNTVFLQKGEHKVKVSGYMGDWNFDYIEVVPADENFVKIITKPELSNKNASESARKLYDYLWSIRGKGILSGQQIYGSNTAEIKTLVAATGKTPAVLGVDLIDFSPSRVERGASGGRLTTTVKKFWEEGGIITCCWHWNAPKDLIDKDVPEMHWYDGFRTKATKFDFVLGLEDPESEEYALMIRDIDAIAKQLKVLNNAGIPVLWRPVHEAAGGWFWWGSKGADNYIKLYKMLYDRLVNYHELNNLIWVWNAQDPNWYPGDEYVDVISYDYYPAKFAHGTADDLLAKIQSATVQPKLCALSENGALPNVVKLQEENSLWSWWCTWNGDFTVAADGKSYSETNTKLSSLKLYYDNPYTITRDEVPNLR